MATKTTLQVVLDILGSAPNSDIKGEIWVEIFKLQLALKGLASAIDSLRAKAALISAGQAVTYQSVGNVNYALYLQDLTKVNVVAGEKITANFAVNFYPDGAGGIVARLSPGIEGAHAFSPNAVAAGATGEFILRGLIGYNWLGGGPYDSYSIYGDGDSNNEKAQQPAASHHRISSYYRDYYKGLLAYYTAWYFGTLGGKKVYEGPKYKYVGVQVGDLGLPPGKNNYNNSVLIYFNPERK